MSVCWISVNIEVSSVGNDVDDDDEDDGDDEIWPTSISITM